MNVKLSLTVSNLLSIYSAPPSTLFFQCQSEVSALSLDCLGWATPTKTSLGLSWGQFEMKEPVTTSSSVYFVGVRFKQQEVKTSLRGTSYQGVLHFKQGTITGLPIFLDLWIKPNATGGRERTGIHETRLYIGTSHAYLSEIFSVLIIRGQRPHKNLSSLSVVGFLCVVRFYFILSDEALTGCAILGCRTRSTRH